ncbi:MAG: hypothetical protein M3417_07195 [Actinomycetota bacterium]|nr:hypothetical protein [Actinomycetota bacterium]
MSDSLLPGDFERLLRQALTPVEPPPDFAARFERTLQNLTDIAADELDAWELGAMRDPRNWPGVARPVAAVAVGGAAGAALVVVRVRAGRRRRRANAGDPLAYVEQTVRAVADEARRVLDR